MPQKDGMKHWVSSSYFGFARGVGHSSVFYYHAGRDIVTLVHGDELCFCRVIC